MGRAKPPEEAKSQWAVMDLKTGDYEPAITWVRQKWKGESFFMGFQEAFAELAKKRLGSEAKDVFLLILGQVDYNNQVLMPQVEMARQLGMKRQNVSRAVAVLIKEEVLIVEEPQLGRNRQLRLNDRYGWKGKLKNLRTQRKSTSKGK